MTVKLLTEHHLEFLSLKGGCTGTSESTHVNMPHCWKSHGVAQFIKLSTYFSVHIFTYLDFTYFTYVLFVCADALHPNPHFFSYVETFSCRQTFLC